MCGLSELRVTGNELTLHGYLQSMCLADVRLTTEDRIRRYAADFARAAFPEHECGEGRIDLHGVGADVVVRLRMMAVGIDTTVDALPSGLMWGAPLSMQRETAPARLYDRAGDDRQGEDERGRGFGALSYKRKEVVIEQDGSMTVTFTSWF